LSSQGGNLVDQCAESGWIVHGHIGQDLAIQIHAGFLQSVHETAVGHVGLLAGGSDAHNPQRSEIALLEAAALIAVTQRLLDRFLCGAVQLALSKEETLGKGERLTTTVATLGTTFYSRHVFSFFLIAPHLYRGRFPAEQARAARCPLGAAEFRGVTIL